MTKSINWNKSVRRVVLTAILSVLALAQTSAMRAQDAKANGERWTRTPRSVFVGVVKETCKSVVSIQGEKQYEVSRRGSDTQYDVFNGMGTGVVIDERGYILTNYHVVKGLLRLEIITADGERYRDVELIRNDVATDLAILKINPKAPLQKIRMGRSNRVELAEDVFAIGNPYGYHCSITRGIVSSLGRPLEVNDQLFYESVIQTDAAVNPGNSGGPLINIDGEMIGLNAAVREDAENIAFAIPIDVVSEVVERMLRQTVAKMTHHGLKFRVVDYEDPDYPEEGNGYDCLIVDSVDAKSPAAAAGVESGDVLLSSNGFEMHNSLDFTCSLIDMGVSDVAELEFSRKGAAKEATIAFSGLAKDSNRNVAVANVSRTSKRYADAETADAVAEEAAELDEDTAASAVPAAHRSVKGRKSGALETVWDVFGVEVRTVDAQEYNEKYSQLQAVAIGDFNFAPSGGVVITRVSPDGIFGAADVSLQKDDLIFGFGVGSSKEGQLSVASLDNLYYIAQRVDEFAEKDSGKARVYLIRNGRPYFLEINLAL